MIELTADEARVLGVLVEKAQTTPEQYPLSLNALVNGANQKNNRDPVTDLDENTVFSAVESLRAKGLVVRVDQMGARVSKFRHNANDLLHVRTAELVILAELMLRGPQTLGELRARASRMHPLESTEQAQGMLDALMNRPEPLAKMIPPSPGTRAQRFVQLLCADSHLIEATTVTAESPAGDFKERINRLEEQVKVLRQAVVQLAGSLGESGLLENLDQKPADS